jgi:PAS domain S-box-containing protein
MVSAGYLERVQALSAGEVRRVAALHELAILDTPTEERFDRITRVTAALFDVPIALVSLVDADRNWIKSCIGMADREVPLSTSFCAVAIERPEPLIVPDTREDPRFAGYATVIGEPYLRFYAGVPIRTMEGVPIGTLCIADHRPRTLDEGQQALHKDLARLVEDELARTDLATALVAQRASDAQVRAVMDYVGEGIITFGEDGVIRTANPAAERAFAFPGGLTGRPIDEILVELPWSEVRAVLPEIIGLRRLVTARRGDGSEFPLELVVSAARVDSERLLIGIGQDVTERLRAQAALRESEQRFRAVFDHAPIAMIVVDLDRTILDANAAMGELLGMPARELRGRSGADLVDPSTELEPLAELLGGDTDRYRREQELRRTDGTTVWVSAAVSVMRDAEGNPLHAVGMLEDITQRKQVERIKDEFVSVVGHELRTPLTSIRGSLGLLDGGLAGEIDDEAGEMVKLALDNTNRLVRLVEDTLDFERLSAGVEELAARPVPARELVDAAVKVVERLCAEAGLELRTEVEDLEVLADPDRIVQALTNLLGNAVKFSPRGGTITLAARRRGRDAAFSVRDEGRGIPAEKLDAIFERFRQVDSSDRREKGGTGLGLAITREIVQRSRGRIWAESGDGEGATFVFTLPLADAAVTVAVVERREEDRAALAARVRAVGVRVVAVTSVDELAGAEAPAAVVFAPGPAAATIAAALDPELPALPADDGLEAALEASIPALRSDRILVVEDDPDLARLLVSRLEHRSCHVELARTGREARDAIERAEPRLVVLDVALPGEDGFTVADWLRRTGRLDGTPLLVYTAVELDDEERERLQLGHTEFLAKAAVPPEELVTRVTEVLEG